jgi:O-methyltransferase involved in polyketide biosynthesis
VARTADDSWDSATSVGVTAVTVALARSDGRGANPACRSQ